MKRSAGLLMYREREVFLVHPGGPFWAKKDLGAWSISKGEYVDGEDPLQAAKREFHEETGFVAASDFLVSAWAFAGDCDPARLVSNHFQMEWPPRSGRTMDVPEVDRAAWFSLAEARQKILKGQLPFLDRLGELLGWE
jgi:predicted NUDIX family NTP pyrophosphohydrolase